MAAGCPVHPEARSANALHRARSWRSHPQGWLARRSSRRPAALQCRHRMARRKGRPHQAGQLHRLRQSGLGTQSPLRPQARPARTRRQRRAHRPRRLARPRRSRPAHRPRRFRIRRPVLHQRPARLCRAQHLSDPFFWKLVELTAKLVSGNPSEEATEVGPLIRPAKPSASKPGSRKPSKAAPSSSPAASATAPSLPPPSSPQPSPA